MRFINYIIKLIIAIKFILKQPINIEIQMLLYGKLLSDKLKSINLIKSIHDVEFKVFSQFGDDGIIQWLINHIDFSNKTFIEFGVGDYLESNTRFLMMNNNWKGFVIDSCKRNLSKIVNSWYFWRHELYAKSAFIDCSNINHILSSYCFTKDIGILSIDLDGNDYWIWKEINVISPILVILEYNSVFGIDRAITIPYNKYFIRSNAHFSNLYFGASLRALYQLSDLKGYSFVGCNSAGNNAYFLRKDKFNDFIKLISLEEGYVVSKFRESKDKSNHLTYVSGDNRIELIKGMPIYNINTDKIEKI